MTTFDEDLGHALHSRNPLCQLRSLAQALFSQGKNRETILALFENARQHLRDEGREEDEDTLMEVMDFLTGWVPPSGRSGETVPSSSGWGAIWNSRQTHRDDASMFAERHA